MLFTLFSLNETLKVYSIQHSTSQCPGHQALKLLAVLSKELGRLVVQGILRIGLIEQEAQTVYDCINVKNRLPVFSQDIEADFSIEINVGMINFGIAFDLGRRMGIVRWNRKGKSVSGVSPVASIGSNNDIERCQVIGIRKLHVHHLAAIQFCNICEKQGIRGIFVEEIAQNSKI